MGEYVILSCPHCAKVLDVEIPPRKLLKEYACSECGFKMPTGKCKIEKDIWILE